MSFHDVRAIPLTAGLPQEFAGLNLNAEIPATGAPIATVEVNAMPETRAPVVKPEYLHFMDVPVTGAPKKKTCKYCGKV
jgi:hypothetical protein